MIILEKGSKASNGTIKSLLDVLISFLVEIEIIINHLNLRK